MIRIFDFKCENGHITEDFVEDGVDYIDCSECASQARKVISPVSFHLPGTDPGYPTAWDKWSKDHKKHGKTKD